MCAHTISQQARVLKYDDENELEKPVFEVVGDWETEKRRGSQNVNSWWYLKDRVLNAPYQLHSGDVSLLAVAVLSFLVSFVVGAPSPLLIEPIVFVSNRLFVL